MEDEYAMGLKNSYMPVKRPYLIDDANPNAESVKGNRTVGLVHNLHKNISLHYPTSNLLEKWDVTTKTT